ncbi:hypothetical protein AB0L65_26420 [Nonomuraea sp. NPDC052116]
MAHSIWQESLAGNLPGNLSVIPPHATAPGYAALDGISRALRKLNTV